MTALRVLLLLLGFTLSFNVYANTWMGGFGDWNDSSKWSTGLVPSESDQVIISASGSLVKIPAEFIALAEQITIFQGAALEIASTASLSLTQMVSVEGIDNAGSLIIHGTLNISGYSAYGIINAGPSGSPALFENNGELNISNGGIGLVFRNNTMADNSGDINIDNISDSNTAGLIIQTESKLENTQDGKINIRDINGADSEGFINEATFVNLGMLIIDDIEMSNGILNNSSDAFFENSGTINISNVIGPSIKNVSGNLSGSGSWEIGLFDNNGNLTPGNSPGLYEITGDFDTNDATSNIQMEIFGNNGPGVIGGHDQISTSGTLTLGGDLEIILGPGFSPEPTDVYELFSYGFVLINSFIGLTLPPELINFELDYTTVPGGVYLVGPGGALPVDLVVFTATSEQGKILLNWETATEVNNQGFDIQHSANSIDWKNIGFVSGKALDQSEGIYNYSFVDLNPVCEQNYYRLVQKDLDGTTSISPIVVIRFECKNEKEGLRIFPNPFTDYFILNTQGPELIQLLNSQGQLIFERENPGRFIETGVLPTGTYILHLIYDRVIHVRRLVKN